MSPRDKERELCCAVHTSRSTAEEGREINKNRKEEWGTMLADPCFSAWLL